MPTRSALRTEVRRILGDTNSVKFTDAAINTWLDMGLSDSVARLGPFDTAMATISTVASEPNYQLPTNCIQLKEVYLQDQSDKETRLYFCTQDDLNLRFGTQWREDDAGQPSVYYQADYNVVGLHPKPDSNNASNTLRFFYYRVPSAFASDSDTPAFTDALHDCVCWYASSRGFAQLQQPDKSDWALGRYKTLIKEFWNVNTLFTEDSKAWKPINYWDT